MVLTSTRGNISNGTNIVLGTFSSHFVFEVLSKISGTMPLEHIVEQDGVVSACMRHKTISDRVSQKHE